MMSVCGPNEVKQHCRELIDVVGKGGGYILDLGAGPDTGRAENVHALVRAAKEFGVY
jgi:uroporphyrinogen-III decarboxylase